MKRDFKELLLSFKLIIWRLCRVDNCVSVIFRLRDLLVINLVLDEVEILLVVRHVCRQDAANHSLSETLQLVFGVLRKEVVLILQHQLRTLGRMEVLLHGLVMVSDGAIGHRVHMEGVVEAVVTEVVTCTRHQEGHHVQMRQVCDLGQLTLCEEQVTNLHNISSMQVIVILHVLVVTLLDDVQERNQLLAND